jgi:ATP synthase F1 gamma subunit
MNDIRSIVRDMNELKTLQVVTRAYTEIAAVRMRKTRNSVLLNREFVTALDDVFADVRASYTQEVVRLATGRRGEEGITFLAHNGKTVAVLLSANTGLYGDIIEKTFRLFLEELKRNPANIEVAIVGRLGLTLFQSEMPQTPYTFFEVPDTNITPASLAQLISHIVQYEEIRVYYPTFQSAIRQIPSRYTISAETPLSELQEKGGRKSKYLFEPSLRDILVFFEREIFASLMDQSVREAQLAKYASRIMTLDRSGENIKTSLKELGLNKLKAEHRIRNRKQLESINSVNLW